MRDPQLSHTVVRRPVAPAPPDAGAAGGQLLLGRYRILETRGSGGFGSVEACWDTRLQRRVAIKCMPLRAPGGPATPASTVDEALSEARTSSLLAHPNIVTVYDFESDGEYAYLVMEYVDGLTLGELLSRVEGGTLTGNECAHVLRSVAAALGYAHENGVLHLDIKPANIMVDRSGAVKLGDFGMATLASAAGYGGARGGTVGYMPPEQICGGLVDERSDIFSLAVVLWQALTGRDPFEARTAEESLTRIRRGPRPALSKLDPGLAGDVESGLGCAVEADASRRMASVHDLAQLVVPALGNPEAGLASLRELLGQTTDDEDGDGPYVEDHGALDGRVPWLGGLVLRALTAACCAWLGLRLAPGLSLADGGARLVLAAVLATAGAAAPTLGGALLVVGLAWSLLAGASWSAAPAVAILVSAAICAVLGTWWVRVGRTSRLSTAALWLPSALLVPFAGVPLAGYGLGPGAALATGFLGWVLERTFAAAVAAGFSATAVGNAVAALATSPLPWIEAVGSGLAACACSAICRRGSRGMAALGMDVGCALVVFSQLVAGRVENGGIWTAPVWSTVGVAVLLFSLMGLATVLFGPPHADQEGD